MIKGYTGIYGSGKTLWSVMDLQWYFKNDYDVYSNTPVWGWNSKGEPTLAKFIWNDDLYAFIGNFEMRTKPTVLFVDEASGIFDSYHYKEIPEETWELLKQSRKVKLDILFTSQRIEDIAPRVRENCAIIYECEKPNLYLVSWYRAIGFHPSKFKDRVPSILDKNYIIRRRISIHWLMKDNFKFYNTSFIVTSKKTFEKYKEYLPDPLAITPKNIQESGKMYKDNNAPL